MPAEDTYKVMVGRVGVIIVNTGTPDEPTPKAVKKYLSKFLMDPHIAPMNRIAWWILLHTVILRKRSKTSAERYKTIWTDAGSPFVLPHQQLAQGLSDYYEAEKLDVHVRYAMSYSKPTIAEAVKELRALYCERLVVLPLYPQSAHSTTGAVEGGLKKAIKRWFGKVTFIDNYHDDPLYIKAVAQSVVDAGFSVDSNDRLLFSFHSIPLKDVDEGDTYGLQVEASTSAIAHELGLRADQWAIGYQSRFDRQRTWLSPFVHDVLELWAADTSGRIFVVCPNFAVDSLETLYELHHRVKSDYFAMRKTAGRPADEEDFQIIPCLNGRADHVRVLINVLKPYVEKGVFKYDDKQSEA